jgi:hypothetical protein
VLDRLVLEVFYFFGSLFHLMDTTGTMRCLGQLQLNEMKLLDLTDTSFIKQAKSAWFCVCRFYHVYAFSEFWMLIIDDDTVRHHLPYFQPSREQNMLKMWQ